MQKNNFMLYLTKKSRKDEKNMNLHIRYKKMTAGLLTAALSFGIFSISPVQAATSLKLSKKTATVTVKLKSGLTSQVKVKVQKSDVAATSVTVLNKSTNKKISGTVTLKMKKKLTLATTVAPVTCKQKVTFTSSNKKIATVTSSGVITAKKKGTVTITVKVGRKSAKVKIKVK